jgi:galactose-1-phosphate uridylyltransferase
MPLLEIGGGATAALRAGSTLTLDPFQGGVWEVCVHQRERSSVQRHYEVTFTIVNCPFTVVIRVGEINTFWVFYNLGMQGTQCLEVNTLKLTF